MSDADVVVVGGGISGLALAWFLRRQGISANVLEADTEPGGTIRTVARDGFLVDTGPNSTLSRGGALDDLIAGVGLQSDVLEADRRAPRYIVKDDRLVALPSGPADFFKTPLFSAAAKWRLLGEPFRGRAAAEESIAQFTRRRIGAEFLDWAVDPFVSGVHAGDPERLSVRAAIPRLYALEARYGSLFIGSLARAFDRRPGGVQPRGRLISFRDGMQTLPRAVARELGSSLRLNAGVRAIARVDGGWVARTADGDVRAPMLVLAVPAPQAAELLAPIDETSARELKAIVYPGVVSVALGFARGQVGHALNGFGALLPRKVKRETLGVIFSSSLFPGRAPAANTLLTAFIGGSRNPTVCDLDESTLIGRVVSDLRPLLDIGGEPVFSYITRWRRAIPQYEIGYGERLARIDASLAGAGFAGLYFCANWRGGISLSDSVGSAAALAGVLAG